MLLANKNKNGLQFRPLLIVFIMIIATAGASGGAVKDILSPDERLWLHNNQDRVILAIETGYAPFVFLDAKGQPTGLAHAYISLLETRLGLQFTEKRFRTLDEILANVRDGEVHIVNAVTKTPERSNFISFTHPYISVPNVIIAQKDNAKRMNEKDLAGLKVALVQNYAVTEYLTGQDIDLMMAPVPDDLTALLNVSFGISDAAVIDLATASYLIAQKGITNLRVAGETAFNIQLSIGVTHTEPVLATIVQKGLAAITEDEKRTIHRHWINASTPSIFNDDRIQVWVGGISCILLVGILAILTWNRTLRRQVAARTLALASEKEALRESEEHLEFILQGSDLGSWDWDLRTNEVKRNERWAVMLGYRLEDVEFTVKQWIDFIHPDDKSLAWQSIQDHLAGRTEAHKLEYRMLAKDGQIRWILDQARVVERDAAQQPLRMSGTHTDITERKRMEQDLENESIRRRTMFEQSPDGILIVDPETASFLDFNTMAHQQLGYSREEFARLCIFDIEAAETPAETKERFTEVCRSGKTEFETLQRTRQGDIRHVHVTAQIINIQGLSSFHCVWRDITESKQAEEEKKNLHVQLLQAQKMEAIGTLAGGIAHDFNNILGAILGYAEMAQEDCPAGSKLRGDLGQIIKAGHRAKDLVKQILAFSRQTETQQTHLQPAGVIDEAIKLLRASLPTTITIVKDIDPNAGIILADPGHIHQILMNLCTNAFHAMEKKGGTLTITLYNKVLFGKDLIGASHMQPGNYVQLSVKDTGAGMTPEVQPRIFDPYFTTKEVGKGTGMGLSTVHGIVHSYGGTIYCDSRPGEGTIFHITLPTVEAHPAREIENTKIPPRGSEHILLVDDEEMLVMMQKTVLKRLGYHVTAESSSLEALATFQNDPEAFDLVITDQTMPDITGMEFSRRILQIRPEMPIILCTGYSNISSEEKAKSIGIKGFALKPLTMKDIAETVRKVLDSGKLTS